MNRSDFQKLAQTRLEEAKVLRDNGSFEGAYYLAGYAVECALKACIAKATLPEEFPPKPKVVSTYYTHDLKQLVAAAELKAALEEREQDDGKFEVNWQLVSGWKEDSRYEFHTEPEANELINAVEDPLHGVFPWLQGYW